MIATNEQTIADPELLRVFRAYSDVTERLKRSHEVLADEVCRLREQIAEKDRELQRRERLAALGEMAAGVAHEIRNPLGGIGIFASLLERDLVDRPTERGIAKRISNGVRNMESIVSDILAFAGGAKPRLQSSLLDAIVRSAIAAVAGRAESADVAVIFPEHHLGAIEIDCDPAQIERAIVNLLLNAVEASPASGSVRVSIPSRGSVSGFASVVIEDDGAGISPQNLQKIFNPFFTTKDAGTGLGLSIVHRIAEEHGGRVTATNREIGGARFVLSLPVGRQESSGQLKSRDSVNCMEASVSNGQCRGN
jgi:signal transduction histidine kinase